MQISTGVLYMAQPWSLGIIAAARPDPQTIFQRIQGMGIPTVQLQYRADWDNEEGLSAIEAARSEAGIEITTVFCSFPGERYDDIPTVLRTVGLVPEPTRAERVAKVDDIAAFARKLGVRRVAAHIGFIPEDHTDPLYATMVEIVQGICDMLKANDQVLALETGQETAKGLKQFLEDVARDNIFVNFDPANMILYGNDQPIPATELLFPWIDDVHCKDGQWPTEKDKLGHETPFGEGDVHVTEWIATLIRLGYCGNFTIEREISGEEQRQDVLKAKELIESELAKYRTEAQ
jgi:sugar phosphate isomerase/epimerase